MMRVSVIIPAYNEEKFLPSLIKSLRNQSMKAFEIIIVDNNSTDTTYTLAKKLADKAYKCKEQGISPARNYGAKKAKGDILAFIDADCIASRDWIKSITVGFKDNRISAMSGLVLYDHQTMAKRIFINTLYTIGFFIGKFMTMMNIPILVAPNIAVKRKVFNDVGGFDKVIGEDVHLAKKLGKLKNIKTKMDIGMRIECSARRIEKVGILKIAFIWLRASMKKISSDNYTLHDKL
ncbi:glycosyltransferase [Candidatus Pacearchaeota archaeon]|nr:glycosyltransferase [Candidatus Pacearchaeota archaeon]